MAQITSTTTLKTTSFKNSFGEYRYQAPQKDLVFGYVVQPLTPHWNAFFATPEKALLDLLYLYPFYNTAAEIEDFRLDEAVIHSEFDTHKRENMLQKFQSQSLESRVKLMREVYGL